MATFVLVHGGGHGGWCWDQVAPLLRAGGHDVHAPTLTGLAERAHEVGPDVDLDRHIVDVVEVLEGHDLHDVVLVGHSYGGMVITGVADRAGARVGKLVFLDAATPADGQALTDVAGPMMEAARAQGRVVDGVELVLWPTEEAGRFYGVTDPDDLAWMQAHLTPHPWRCFEQPLRLGDEAAVRAIPDFHVICTSTRPTRSRSLLARVEAAGRLWEIDTGHDLMITEPHAVADALSEVAAR